MIIELRNIHAMWKLLIENTCMLRANGNKTMWNRMGFGVHGCVTNKGKTNYMEGIDVAKLKWKGDRDRENNNAQNRPCNLHQAYPVHGPFLPAGSRLVARSIAVRRCFTHSDLQGVEEVMRDGDSDGR
jgi:hypothetical protein